MSAYEDPQQRPAQEKMIALDKIQLTRSTQGRLRMNPDHVQRLREEVLERGLDFTDRVEVYDDGFGKLWVGDGFHRLEAYQQAGRDKIRALVREGTERDAMIHAAGANTRHGLRRSRENIRRCIRLLLKDKQRA
jgi:hypothetical protein